MELSEETKQLLTEALRSHESCVHTDPSLCNMLILAEVSMVRGDAVTTEEEMEACGHFLTNQVLESLLLKGIVEPVGISDDGEFFLGLTAAGEAEHERIKQEQPEWLKFFDQGKEE